MITAADLRLSGFYKQSTTQNIQNIRQALAESSKQILHDCCFYFSPGTIQNLLQVTLIQTLSTKILQTALSLSVQVKERISFYSFPQIFTYIDFKKLIK